MALLFKNIPFSYSLLSYLLSMVILAESAWYIRVVAPVSIKQLMSSMKQKSKPKKEEIPKTLTRQTPNNKEPIIIHEPSKYEKKPEPTQATPNAKTIEEKINEKIEKPVIKPDNANPIDVKQQSTLDGEDFHGFEEEPIEPPKEEKQPVEIKTPPPVIKQVEKIEYDDEEPKISPIFEQALSSAVNKRKIGEVKDDKKEKKKPEKQPEKTVKKEPVKKEEKEPMTKQLTVKCPGCQKTFPLEKGDDIARIECPHCGKKGVTNK